MLVKKVLKLMRKIFFFCNHIRINGDLHRNMYFFKGALHSTKQLYYALLNSKLIRLLFLKAEQLCTAVTRFPVDFQKRCKFSTCVTFILDLSFQKIYTFKLFMFFLFLFHISILQTQTNEDKKLKRKYLTKYNRQQSAKKHFISHHHQTIVYY